MMTLPTLFKKDSKGKTRIWVIEVIGNTYRTISGLQEGKQVISEWTLVYGKNKGKSNETSDEDQAVKEAVALHNKKLKSNYHLDKNDIDTPQFFTPMLANKWDEKDTIFKDTKVVFVNPKLDGIRGVSKPHTMSTRKGHIIPTAEHIVNALKPLFNKYPNVVLDGELYNHDLKEDFNSLSSIIRKVNPDRTDLIRSRQFCEYHVYDYLREGNTEELFENRYNNLVEDLRQLGSPYIKLVKALACTSIDDILKAHKEFLKQGYEGTMIRLNKPYQNKRSKYLLKYKPLLEEEYTIIDILEGKGNWANVAKIVVFLDNTGGESKATIKGSKTFCKKIYEDKSSYIGQQVTVQFQNYTPDGIPRFPIAKTLHKRPRW